MSCKGKKRHRKVSSESLSAELGLPATMPLYTKITVNRLILNCTLSLSNVFREWLQEHSSFTCTFTMMGVGIRQEDNI